MSNKEPTTRQWANRIRDAYTLTEAEDLLTTLLEQEYKKGFDDGVAEYSKTHLGGLVFPRMYTQSEVEQATREARISVWNHIKSSNGFYKDRDGCFHVSQDYIDEELDELKESK